MFRLRKYSIFYLLIICLVLFENCRPDEDESEVITEEGDTEEGDTEERKTDNDTFRIELFYSPIDRVSRRFLNNNTKPMLETDIGQYIDLRLHPIANCDLRVTGAHVGDDENSHKPIICTSGPDETTLALEQYCGYWTLARPDENKDERRKGMLNGINYCLCTIKQPRLPAAQKVEECQKTLNDEDRRNIQRCLDKADTPLWRSYHLYKNTTFGFYPYMVINKQHKRDWDIDALRDLNSLLCGIMKNKPKDCAKQKVR